MYSNAATNNKFTGEIVSGEYVYPAAEQNAVIKFGNFYLSALDNDFADSGLTFQYMSCDSEDITIGNAPAAVLNVAMLDPHGLMENLTWGEGTAYIGVVTATATADTYTYCPNGHIYVNSIHYGFDSSNRARRGTSYWTLGGTPKAVVANSNGTDVYFVTDTSLGRYYNSSFSVINSPTAEQSLIWNKYQTLSDPIGIALDASGIPTVFNSVADNTKTTYTYIPMGVYDFSNVEAAGISFQVEAYDRMTLFDADATDWVQSLDFTSPKPLYDANTSNPSFINELMTEMGLSYTVSASAVNTSITWDQNPITSYSVTYRQILKWLAEAIGCNVRMSRTGTVEFVRYSTTPVGNTITPDTIVGNTRTKGKKLVPQVTKLICYNTVGAGYETGNDGSNYYIVANPFIDPSASLNPIINLLGVVDDIPAYYPTVIGVMYSDPRIDAGDFITVTDTDGSTTYNVPVVSQTINWNGVCNTEYVASGNQVRLIPEAITDCSDLSGVVSSNPAAVVNQIEAVGINADWITSGSIDASQIAVTNIDADNITSGTIDADVINVTNVTAEKVLVKDTSDRVVFSADSSTHAVNIGFFGVGYDGLWVNSGGRQVGLDGATGTLLSSYNGKTATHTSDFFKAENNSNHHYSTVTSEGLEVSGGGNTTSLDSSSLSVGNSNDGTTLTASGVITVNKFPNTITVSPPNITFNDGTETSALSVIKRTNSGSSSVSASIDISLERGVYLAVTTHTNNTTASQSGLAIVQAYDTNSSVLHIATAGNSTLTVSGLTLTWTVTNTYRALRLIKLT